MNSSRAVRRTVRQMTCLEIFANIVHEHQLYNCSRTTRRAIRQTNNNGLSYLVELIIDKLKKHISNEALKLRLRKGSAAFGVHNIPTDVRGIGRFLGARSIDEVTRHRCGNIECSYSWIGAVRKSDHDSFDVCPDRGTPRYVLVRGILKPQRVFYYFGATQAIEALHRHPTLRANWKKNSDISLHAYRESPDAARLNEATHGEALAVDNNLYIATADGFQMYNSKTQSVTGDGPVLLMLLLPMLPHVLLLTCVVAI